MRENTIHDESPAEPIGRSSELDIANVTQVLETVNVDETVKIKVAHLGEVNVGGTVVEYSAAQIDGQVNAHVHMLGGETYIVMRGQGLMHAGKVDGTSETNVTWNEPQKVSVGDVFTIPAAYAHSLENIGSEPLTIVFFGSPSDLTTDRTMLNNPPAERHL